MSNQSKDPVPGSPASPVSTPDPVDAWIVRHESMGGGSNLPIAYLNKRAAELECEAKNSKASREFENFSIKPIKVRLISDTEGAFGRELVMINRTEPKDILKRRALAKLTREEKEALGL